MKRLIFFFLFSCFFSFAQAQTYAYSFEGTLDAQNEAVLTQKLSQLTAVTGVKLKLKSDQNMGEAIIDVDPMENRGEMDHPFSPKFVKELYIEFGLTPMSFRKLQ